MLQHSNKTSHKTKNKVRGTIKSAVGIVKARAHLKNR